MTNDELLTGARRIPVFLLTGFLGSGKTSLLVRLLKERAMARTAIVVNEFGDVGIDQLTLRRVDDQVRLLEHGCLCCTTREDLLATLRELYVGRLDGTLEPFDRVVIETTGLADPFPVVHTLLIDPLLQERFQYAGTVTTIDTGQPAEELSRRSESARQVAIADAFILTKTDRADAATIEFVEALLGDANPDATVARNDEESVDALARRLADDRLVATQPIAVPDEDSADTGRGRLPAATIERLARVSGGGSLFAAASGRYSRVGHTASGVVSYVLRIDEPVEWPLFAEWLQRLIASNRDTLLRIKGVVQVRGQPDPILIQAVRHLFHPAVPLPRTPEDPPGSRIVVIVDNPTHLARAEVGVRTLGDELFEASLSGTGALPGQLDRALR